ncbi:MAG: AAA family ATPase [Archangium sp.]
MEGAVVIITEYSVENFRCFGSPVTLSELKAVNVIAGANNVGKSALLHPLRRLTRLDRRFIERIAPPGGGGTDSSWDAIGEPRFGPDDLRGSAKPRFTFSLMAAENSRLLPPSILPPGKKGTLEFSCGEIGTRDIHAFSTTWIIGTDRRPGGTTILEDGTTFSAQILARKIADRIVHVPALRRVGYEVAAPDTHALGERRMDGASLFGDAVHWTINGRDPLARVEAFASEVLGQDVRLLPSTRPVQLGVKVGRESFRDLKSLGMGIEQVLVIAHAATKHTSPILILEEPELGLHPLIQRSLVSTLAKEKGTVSFITTHSPHVLDLENDDVRHHHLSRDAHGNRRVRSLSTRDHHLISDLGVRPSSLLQANAAVWVEGPSDAIYLRAWLKFRASKLVEHHDFTFVTYGGALLEHFSGEATNRERLVQLFKVNPSWFVVMDSDRAVLGGALGHDYASRMLQEAGERRTWVTQGKEIESYLNDDELACGRQLARSAQDRFAPLDLRLEECGLPRSWAAHKTDLAHRVTAATASWTDRMGLFEQLDKLVRFIGEARQAVVA